MHFNLKLLILFCFTFLNLTTHAQENNPAKTYYEEAEKARDTYKYSKEVKLLEKSSDLGYAPAHKRLAIIYSNKDGKTDRIKMFAYTLRAAEAGDSMAMETVAFYYKEGIITKNGTEKDLNASAQWYEKAIAHGNEQAIFDFAKFYLDKDAGNSGEEAMFWFKKAADKGDLIAKTYYYVLTNNLQAAYDLGAEYAYVDSSTKDYSSRKKIAENIYSILSDFADPKGTFLYGKFLMEHLMRSKEAYLQYKLALSRGYPVPEKYFEAIRVFEDFAKSQTPVHKDYATVTNRDVTSTERKKTCPICNGTGKNTDRYTTEKRDWNNKTITFTDHTTTRNCIRCNGTGYIVY